MIETILYLNGKYPKIISYIDEDEKNYVTLKVKLKEDISEFEFKKFLLDLKILKSDLLSRAVVRSATLFWSAFSSPNGRIPGVRVMKLSLVTDLIARLS